MRVRDDWGERGLVVGGAVRCSCVAGVVQTPNPFFSSLWARAQCLILNQFDVDNRTKPKTGSVF